MSDTLPMFPLNAVLFPGVSVPLRVFEDRYRALVHHLLRVEDPTERVFGSVGIREGYEVGDHGAQSLFRVGCRVKMTEVEAHPDGTFDAGGGRARPDRARAARHHRPFPVGHVVDRPETGGDGARGAASSAPARRSPPTGPRSPRSAATPTTGDLPQDPSYLSWTLAAWRRCPCTSGRRCSRPRTPTERLRMVTDLLRDRAARDERASRRCRPPRWPAPAGRPN